MSRQLWKVIYSNARSAVRSNGKKPQRIYPYVDVSHVGVFLSKEYQTYLNDCAKFVLVFCSGVWLD
jgi:hypothetical protein